MPVRGHAASCWLNFHLLIRGARATKVKEKIWREGVQSAYAEAYAVCPPHYLHAKVQASSEVPHSSSAPVQSGCSHFGPFHFQLSMLCMGMHTIPSDSPSEFT
jgi:hypothetical protein